MLVEDRDHGEHNRAVIERWVADWAPAAEEAAAGLAELASVEVRPNGVDPVAALLAEAGLGAATADGGNGADPVRARRVRPPRERKVQVKTTDPSSVPDPSVQEDYVGIVMAKSAEGDAVAAILSRRDGIEVIEQPSFWDIRSRDRMSIPYDDVSEQLGYEIDAYSIQHEMSTHYGRMVTTDDALMLFADPTEAMQYLMTADDSRDLQLASLDGERRSGVSAPSRRAPPA